MEDSALRQRRNLIGISAALSVYELVCRGPDDKPPQLFGVLPLEDGGVVFYLAWMAYFYLIWRYWIHTKNLREPEHRSHNNNGIWENEGSWMFAIQDILTKNEQFRILSMDKAPRGLGVKEHQAALLARGVFSKKLDYSLLTSTGTQRRRQHTGEVRVGYFLVFWMELRAQIIATFRYPQFSDYLLPYFLAAVPVIIVIIKRGLEITWC